MATDHNFKVKNGLDVLGGTASISGGHLTLTSNSYGVNTRSVLARDTNGLNLGTSNGTTALSIDNSGNITMPYNLTITGNLTVNGTTTTLNTATLDVEDKNITLNYGSGDTSGSANGAGITIQDAVNSTTDASILWDASADEFDFSHTINISGELYATNSSNNLVIGNSASGNIYLGGGNNNTSNIYLQTGSSIALTLNSSNDATFAGTISSGAIASTGTISTTGQIEAGTNVQLGGGFNLSWGGAYSSGNPTIAANSNTLYFYPTGNVSGQRLYLNASKLVNAGTFESGDIGINVASPSSALDIRGAGSGASQKNTIAFGTSGWGNPTAPNAALDGGVKLALFEGGTQKVQIGMDANARLWLMSAGSGAQGVDIYTGSSNTSAPSLRFRVDQSGTTNIYGALSASGNLTGAALLIDGNTAVDKSGTNYMVFHDGGGGPALYAGNTSDNRNYYQSNHHRFRSDDASTSFAELSSAGLRIGGVSTPAEKLHVESGNIRADGAYIISGTTVIDSSRVVQNVTLGHSNTGARFETNDWMYDTGGKARFYFEGGGRTFFGSDSGYVYRDSSDVGRATISNYGGVNLLSGGDGQVGSTVALAVGGTTVIDSSRNLSNIGTLSTSGDIDAGGRVKVTNWLELESAGAANTTEEAGIRIDYNDSPLWYIYKDNANDAALHIQSAGASGEGDGTPRVRFNRTARETYFGGAVGINQYSITSNTALDVSGNSRITGSGSSSNALNVYRGSDGTSALRVLNTGEVLVSSNYFYVDASQGAYFNGNLRARGGISNDNGDLLLGDDVRISGDLDVDGIIDNTRNNANVAAPNTSDHTAGTRISFYDTSATAWYAMGIESNTLWFNSDVAYKWYQDGALRMHLDGSNLNLTSGAFQINGTNRINNVGDGLFTSLYIGSTNVIDTSRNVIATSFRPGVSNAWKIRPNSGNAQLAFEYSTSTTLADSNIKAELGSGGDFIVGDRISNKLSGYQIELKKASTSIGDGGGAGALNLRTTGNFYIRHNGSDRITLDSSSIVTAVGIHANMSDNFHSDNALRGGVFSADIANDTTVLKLFPASHLDDGGNTRAASDYNTGIGFMHLDPAIWGTSYLGMQAWIGLRVHDVAGQERDFLTFATNNSTTSGSFPVERMCISPEGYVGIGETDPSKNLHIYTSNNEGIFLEGTGGGVWMDVQSNSSQLWSMGADGNGWAIYNRNNNTYRLRCENGNDVDIVSGGLKVGGTTVIDSSRNITASTAVIYGGADNKLQLRETTGGTVPWNYIEYRNSANTRNAYIGTNTSGDFQIYGETGMSLLYTNMNFTAGGITNSVSGYQVNGTTVIDSSRNLRNVTAHATDAEYGQSMVGNFGQWLAHSRYASSPGFNTDVDYWGWNFVQGNVNAPHTASGQWYRNRVSLGNAYGHGSASGDYWLEMAYPRTTSTAGSMYIRACESGSIGSWYEVGANIRGSQAVAGSITAQGNITAYSDERLKSNIQTLDGSKVLQMRGVSFTKNEEAGSGVIAQELEKIAPELVHDNEDGYKSVAYGNLTGYLIEAIKEQQEKIEKLEELVQKLISEK